MIRLPLNQVGLPWRISLVVSRLQHEMSWGHVIGEVSRQLDVPVQKILTAMHGALPVRSLDEPLREHEAHNLLQLLPSQTQEPPDEEAIRASDRQLLERVLACLDEREQYIIRAITDWMATKRSRWNASQVVLECLASGCGRSRRGR